MKKPNIEEIDRISINLLELKPLEDLNNVSEFYKSNLEHFFDKDGQPLKEFFEFISCPVCGSALREHKVTIDYFVYNECSTCRAVYNNPRLKNDVLNKMYTSGEYKTYFEQLVVKSQALRKNVIDQRKFRQINSFFETPGKILDVGCGSGSFLKVCNENGWKVYGLDPSLSAVKVAEEMYDLKIICQGFESFETDLSYDCITFWGLEHLPDPMEGMKKAFYLLKEGGVIVFESPSADCFLMAYICSSTFSPYRYIENARHVLFFSKDSIEFICKKFNLELAHLESNGLDMQTILPFEFENDILSRIFQMQRIIDEKMLGDHYRVFLRKRK